MEAKIVSKDGNLVVVHVPGRSFPGAVIQGDKLHWVVNRLTLAAQLLMRDTDMEEHFELWQAIGEARAHMSQIYDYYTKVCQSEEHKGDW